MLLQGWVFSLWLIPVIRTLIILVKVRVASGTNLGIEMALVKIKKEHGKGR